jgi:hypothetical protein
MLVYLAGPYYRLSRPYYGSAHALLMICICIWVTYAEHMLGACLIGCDGGLNAMVEAQSSKNLMY